ncbi:GNAT family N-acetyltransferase [Cytobacillus sp. IB215665]|uniref:GNAT family N-acetyltransferase n=1 Tax=Cytobacillus sp. IB215665 TaxID=3097357 RepID=UPI002A0D03CE|nr:GNAT family N-acetyltransferase [Cytobacillus sp. IB215665]MDX8365663.1 GNAT family N-acetyltransferase [Cytobacillus sp. IB215665]
MNWYEKLNQYFPIEEMKSKEHMEALLKEKSNIYFKDEGLHHVLMYVETEEFIMIDYLFVSKNARGQGLGHKLINKMKQQKKPILLEVEPLDYEDTDTEKRFRFYKREGFTHAKNITYRRRSLATDKVNEMEILYWTPHNETEKDVEQTIFRSMKKTYENIHTYKDEKFYGQSYQPVDEVLTFQHDNNDSNNSHPDL